MSVKLVKHNDSGWKWLNACTKYRKLNGIVFVHISSYGNVSIPANEYISFGTLLEGYKPDTIVQFTMHNMSSNMNNQSCLVQPNGEIRVLMPVATSYFGGTVSFIAA